MPPLQLFGDKENPEDWRVEDNDADGAGGCEVTIFSGYRAEERAREYAERLSCSRSQSSALANSADSCSNWLTTGWRSCSHYLPLCSPSSARARQRRLVLIIPANERSDRPPGSNRDTCRAELLGEFAGAAAAGLLV